MKDLSTERNNNNNFERNVFDQLNADSAELCDCINEDLYTISAWVSDHKRDYRKLLNYCNKELNSGTKEISLLGIIMQMNWEGSICIDCSISDQLEKYIIWKNPIFKGRFKKCSKKKKTMSKAQFINLLSQFLPI